jgi:hypothetical protein
LELFQVVDAMVRALMGAVSYAALAGSPVALAGTAEVEEEEEEVSVGPGARQAESQILADTTCGDDNSD